MVNVRKNKLGISRAILIGAIIVVVIVAAVGGYFAYQQIAKPPAKLVVAARSGTYAEGLKIAAKEFSAKYGVEVIVHAFGYKGLHDKLVTEMLEKTGAFDVVMLDDPWLPEFAARGFLVDIDAMLKERGITLDPDFIPTCIEVSRYKAKLYALPYVGNVQLSAYRKDLFEKYGLPEPKTWEDVLHAAKVITEKEGIYGYVIRGKKGNPVVTNFLPIFWAYGARIVDEGGKPRVYSPEGVESLKVFVELKKYSPAGTENFGSAEVRALLLEGKVGIVGEVWPAWVPDLEDPTKSKVVGKVKIIPPPGAKPMIGAWLLGIPVTSKNKDLALKFMLFTLSKEMQKKMTLEAGVPPTRASLYRDSDIVAKYPWYPVQLEALMTARMRPRIPVWKKVEDTLASYIHAALTGELTSEEALRKANEELAKILAST